VSPSHCVAGEFHEAQSLTNTLLQVKDLKMEYRTRKGVVRAVEGVSFEVLPGEFLGLAGESGCGKTTSALSIVRLLPENATIIGGQILFEDKDILRMSEEELRSVRWKKISIIFQGSMNALNPVKTVGDQITEAIRQHEDVPKAEAEEKVARLLEMVGIDPERIKSYPHELSGGMRQRVMIAMSLACNPKLVIADEPVTALDVMIQAQILELIKSLKEELGLSIILITHDIAVIAEVCNRVAIMYAGKLVECADVLSIFKEPMHPYTAKLISAVPKLRGGSGTLESIPGNPPDLANPPAGCRFSPRCHVAKDICTREDPLLREVKKGHYAACYTA